MGKNLEKIILIENTKNKEYVGVLKTVKDFYSTQQLIKHYENQIKEFKAFLKQKFPNDTRLEFINDGNDISLVIQTYTQNRTTLDKDLLRIELINNGLSIEKAEQIINNSHITKEVSCLRFDFKEKENGK